MKIQPYGCIFSPSVDLFSQAPSGQVSSALTRFIALFEMGRDGAKLLLTLGMNTRWSEYSSQVSAYLIVKVGINCKQIASSAANPRAPSAKTM